MIARIGPVTADAATAQLVEQVYRNRDIPAVDSQAISVEAAGPDLLGTVQGQLWAGQFLNPATARTAGHRARSRRGCGPGRRPGRRPRHGLAGQHPFDVVGILDPVTLAPELDRSALIGFPAARQLLHREAPPSEIYVRTNPGQRRCGPAPSSLPRQIRRHPKMPRWPTRPTR